MLEGQRATLDDFVLKNRLRLEFSNATYQRREIKSPQPRTILDIAPPKAVKPTPSGQNALKKLDDHSSTPIAKIEYSPTPKPAVQPDYLGMESATSEVAGLSSHQDFTLMRPKGSKLQLAFTTMAIVMVFVGGYLSLSAWHTNTLAQAQAAKLTKQANSKSESSSAVLSTVKPKAPTVASYTVAPNLPRYLMIPKLGLKARVLSVGTTKTGALETPNNVYDTAWYNKSAQPGEPGAMLIDGHVSSWTAHGVFYGIKNLSTGDVVKIQRGDGTTFTYKVVKSQVYSASDVDMSAAMEPVVAGHNGLNLITCTGDVIPGTSEFNKRIVVFTEQE